MQLRILAKQTIRNGLVLALAAFAVSSCAPLPPSVIRKLDIQIARPSIPRIPTTLEPSDLESLLYLHIGEYPWRKLFTIRVNDLVVARDPELNQIFRIYLVPGDVEVEFQFHNTDGKKPDWVTDAITIQAAGGAVYRYSIDFGFTMLGIDAFSRLEYLARANRTLRLCDNNRRLCTEEEAAAPSSSRVLP